MIHYLGGQGGRAVLRGGEEGSLAVDVVSPDGVDEPQDHILRQRQPGEVGFRVACILQRCARCPECRQYYRHRRPFVMR